MNTPPVRRSQRARAAGGARVVAEKDERGDAATRANGRRSTVGGRRASDRAARAAAGQVDHRVLAAVLDAMDAAVYLLDRERRVVFGNRAAEKLTGYALDDLVGRPVPASLRPIGVTAPAGPSTASTAQQASAAGADCWVRQDGSRRCGRWSEHEFVVPGTTNRYLIVSLTDTTEQVEIAADLAAERDFVSAVLWTVPALVVVVDAEGRVERFNKAFADATGLELESLRGQRMWDRIFPADRVDEAMKVFADLCTRGSPVRTVAQMLTADGQSRQVAWHANVLRDGEGRVKYVLACGIDVTSERTALADLRAANDRLRAVAKAMEHVREDERRRIARELHDELGQALAGLRMDLEAILGEVAAECSTAPAAECHRMHDQLKHSIDGVDQVVASVRRVSAELRPLVLDDLGLGAAVEWFAENFAQRSGLACQVHVAERCADVPEPQATALFRIMQESLTNIARHARARNVRIDLGGNQRELTLRIADDGIGFIRNDREPHRQKFGMLGMRERAQALGGDLRVESTPGSGTTLTVAVPAPRDASEAS